MRLIVTADLHYNHGKSHALADEVIEKINRESACPAEAGHAVVVVVGDTATFDGDALERCLSRFTFAGPKLFVAGNHELWTTGDDSYENFRTRLRFRVEQLGWQWLQSTPFIADDIAIVGSIGWYDYSLAQKNLGIPKSAYAAKISPDGSARWNDGRFVKLHRSDEEFLDELLAELKSQLDALRHVPYIVAAVHHLPFAELLPPPHNAQWDFAKAYLGSEKIGQLFLTYPNVRTVLCGHSHFAMEATIGHIHAINIGSGYRAKTFRMLDIPG